MSLAMRIASFLGGFAFLALGWIWTYWIAAIGWLLGGIAWGLSAWVRRRESSDAIERTAAQANMDTALRWLLAISAIISLIALGATLLAN